MTAGLDIVTLAPVHTAGVWMKEVARRFCSESTQRRLRVLYVSTRVRRGIGKRESELRALPSLVRRGDHVVDIGANVGIYTKALSQIVGPSGKVHSFEPIAENYEILCTVVRRARLANVETIRLAVGDRPGRWEMVIPDAGGFGGYYRAHLADASDEGRREPVEVQTLDALSSNGTLERVDVVKCDVEGAEHEVLAGGRTLFAAQHPTSLIELDRSTGETVFAFFAAFGYRAFVFDHRLVPVDRYKGRGYGKYIFVHPSRPLRSRPCPRDTPHARTAAHITGRSLRP